MKCVIEFLAANGIEVGKNLVKYEHMFSDFENQSDLEPGYGYQTIILVKDEDGYYIHTVWMTTEDIRLADDEDEIGGFERLCSETEEDAIEYFDSVVEELWSEGYDE